MKKVAKTGAQRIREYRARIIAYEKAVAARSVTNVEAVQTESQQNIDYNLVDKDEDQHLLLYESLLRQNILQEDVPLLPESPPTNTMQMQSSAQTQSSLRKHSEIAKTPAPSTSGSSNSMVCNDNCVANRETSFFGLFRQNLVSGRM